MHRCFLQAAQQGVAVLGAQPSWVHGGALYPHQLEAVNWLRRMWAEGRPALLADGGGLGKTASVITFLQSLRYGKPCVSKCYAKAQCTSYSGTILRLISDLQLSHMQGFQASKRDLRIFTTPETKTSHTFLLS